MNDSHRQAEALRSGFAAPPALPRFRHAAPMIGVADLAWNPSGDVIFPTVVDMAKYLDDPLDRFYMYFAPHGPPSDICLATAPTLKGPWTEYVEAPIITRNWDPHYRASHVSSPHTLWIEEEQQFFCFYHGNNDTTRYASSADGLHWEYEGVALCTDDLPPSESISYNRVYRHVLSAECRYIQTVVQYHPTRQGIHIARSPDARRWTVDPAPLLTPLAVPGCTYVWSACLVDWRGEWYLVYHVDFFIDGQIRKENLQTDIYVSRVNEALTEAGPAELLFRQEAFNGNGPPGRVADPFLIEEAGTLFLFASAGIGGTQFIVCAEGN